MDGDAELQPVTLNRRGTSKQQHKAGWIPKDNWAKVALLLSIAQLLICGGLELWIAITHYDFVDSGLPVTNLEKLNGEAIFAYHVLFMFAQLFQLVLIGDALAQLSLIQLVTTTVFNWAIWGYSIIQHQQAATWVTTSNSSKIPGFHPTALIEQVLIVVLLAFCLGWLFITFKLYYVFGWTTYKEMGADVEVRNVLYLYHIYMLLLKIDVFFFLGFSFQFAWLVLNNEDAASTLGLSAVQIHLLISIPGALIMLLFAYFAVRKEKKWLVYAALFAFTGGAVYLLIKLYGIWGPDAQRFTSSKNSLTFFIVMTLIMIVMTMTVAILNMRRFGEGLMDKLDTPAFEDNYNSYAFEAPTQLNSLDPRQNYRLSPQQQKRSQHSSGRR